MAALARKLPVARWHVLTDYPVPDCETEGNHVCKMVQAARCLDTGTLERFSK